MDSRFADGYRVDHDARQTLDRDVDDDVGLSRLTLLGTTLDGPEHQQTTILASRRRDPSTAYLDGLRGLAALFVLIQHYIGHFDLGEHEHGFGESGHYYFASFPFIRILFSGGHAGVAIFFVLSGYVLSKSPLRLIRDGGSRQECGARLLSAVIRRPIRLYSPPLVTTLVTAIVMHAPYGILPDGRYAVPEPSLYAELRRWIVEFVAFFSPFRTHNGNMPWFTYGLVLWTIPVEFKGSVLVYFLTGAYAFSGLSRSLSLLLLGGIGIVLLYLGVWTMACFVAGHMLAYLDIWSLDLSYITRRFTQRAQSILWHTIFIIGYYFLCEPAHGGLPEYSRDTPGWAFLTGLIPKAYGNDQYYRYWHSWGALMLIYATLRILSLQQFLNTRPLRYLGKVSFMLYLVHSLIIETIGYRVARCFGHLGWDTPESWWNNKLPIPDIGPTGFNTRFLLSLAITLPICLVTADFATKWVDTPVIHASKVFADACMSILPISKTDRV